MSKIKIEKFEDAVDACDKSIKKHTYLSYAILLVIFLYAINTYQITINDELLEKQSKDLEKYYTESYALNVGSYENINKNIKAADMLSKDLMLLEIQIYSTNNTKTNKDSITKFIRSFNKKTINIIDSLNKIEKEAYSYRNHATNSNMKIIDNLIVNKEPSSSMLQYIKYLLNFMVIGVLIFIYKFHLNQAKKYEHYLFALARIKIANEENSPLDENSKMTLLSDAFSESDTKNHIDSPIDGHPISDTITGVLNKILDKLDDMKK